MGHRFGAHHVIDHSKPMPGELQRIGFSGVDYIASLNQTGRHFDEIVASVNPQGHIAPSDDQDFLDIRQHELLARAGSLIDAGVLRTTLAGHFGTVNAANLRRAHEWIETNRARGKIVLEGF